MAKKITKEEEKEKQDKKINLLLGLFSVLFISSMGGFLLSKGFNNQYIFLGVFASSGFGIVLITLLSGFMKYQEIKKKV